MQVSVSVQKIAKFGVSISGDTVEVVERPRGGFSVILADGQGSGKGAKRISNLVVNKASALIGDGGRDGAVARTVHDYLYTLRYGKVSCEMQILSVDLNSNSLVLSRNCRVPALFLAGEEKRLLSGNGIPIGTDNLVKPHIDEFPLVPGTRVMVFSDGIWHSGSRFGEKIKEEILFSILARGENADLCAGEVLEEARKLDRGTPKDDMTVIVLEVSPKESESQPKKMTVEFPIK